MTTEIIDGCGCCGTCTEVDSWQIQVEYDWSDTTAQTHPWRQTILNLSYNSKVNSVDLGALGYPIMPDPIADSYFLTPYTATISSPIVVQVPKNGWSGGTIFSDLCDELVIPAGSYTMTYQGAAKAAYQSFYSNTFTP